TAPDRIWPPTSAAFSITTTLISPPSSAALCFSRLAAARPAGPAPTMTTSYSALSRTVAGSRTAGHLAVWVSSLGGLRIEGWRGRPRARMRGRGSGPTWTPRAGSAAFGRLDDDVCDRLRLGDHHRMGGPLDPQDATAAGAVRHESEGGLGNVAVGRA